MIRRLAWATAAGARGRDPDQEPSLAALAAAGVRVDVVDWDDPSADWASYDRVALRSTWDYQDRLDGFLAWLARVDAVTQLRNPLAMVRWSLDKRYLGELAAAGLAVVPTTFVEPGRRLSQVDGDFVVKPSVGASSRGVRVHRTDHLDDAHAHIARLHADGNAALVQPLFRSIDRDGERPLVFLDGQFSHAAVRHISHGTTGADRTESARPHHPDDAQLAVARDAVDHIAGRFGRPSYARVDLVADDAGRPHILEVELVEPSLFIPEGGPGAVDRLVRALAC